MPGIYPQPVPGPQFSANSRQHFLLCNQLFTLGSSSPPITRSQPPDFAHCAAETCDFVDLSIDKFVVSIYFVSLSADRVSHHRQVVYRVFIAPLIQFRAEKCRTYGHAPSIHPGQAVRSESHIKMTRAKTALREFA